MKGFGSPLPSAATVHTLETRRFFSLSTIVRT
jgi:hypothetical protein